MTSEQTRDHDILRDLGRQVVALASAEDFGRLTLSIYTYNETKTLQNGTPRRLG